MTSMRNGESSLSGTASANNATRASAASRVTTARCTSNCKNNSFKTSASSKKLSAIVPATAVVTAATNCATRFAAAINRVTAINDTNCVNAGTLTSTDCGATDTAINRIISAAAPAKHVIITVAKNRITSAAVSVNSATKVTAAINNVTAPSTHCAAAVTLLNRVATTTVNNHTVATNIVIAKSDLTAATALKPSFITAAVTKSDTATDARNSFTAATDNFATSAVSAELGKEPVAATNIVTASSHSCIAIPVPTYTSITTTAANNNVPAAYPVLILHAEAVATHSANTPKRCFIATTTTSSRTTTAVFAKIANNSAATAKIANDSAATAKIANNSAATAKIVSASATTAKIANDSAATANDTLATSSPYSLIAATATNSIAAGVATNIVIPLYTTSNSATTLTYSCNSTDINNATTASAPIQCFVAAATINNTAAEVSTGSVIAVSTNNNATAATTKVEGSSTITHATTDANIPMQCYIADIVKSSIATAAVPTKSFTSASAKGHDTATVANPAEIGKEPVAVANISTASTHSFIAAPVPTYSSIAANKTTAGYPVLILYAEAARSSVSANSVKAVPTNSDAVETSTKDVKPNIAATSDGMNSAAAFPLIIVQAASSVPSSATASTYSFIAAANSINAAATVPATTAKVIKPADRKRIAKASAAKDNATAITEKVSIAVPTKRKNATKNHFRNPSSDSNVSNCDTDSTLSAKSSPELISTLDEPNTSSTVKATGLWRKKKYQCVKCALKFTTNKNRMRHTAARVCPGLKELSESDLAGLLAGLRLPKSSALKRYPCGHKDCVGKQERYEGKVIYRQHLHDAHSVNGILLCFQQVFPNFEDFMTWKAYEEKASLCRYSKVKSDHYKEKLLVRKYTCHRSGNYSSQGTGKRRTPSKGSCKIGQVCPAEILATVLSCGTVKVEYYPTHFGHTLDPRHLRLSRSERDRIAELYRKGLTREEILENIHSSSTAQDLLLRNLTATDLRNIRHAYNMPAPVLPRNSSNNYKKRKRSVGRNFLNKRKTTEGATNEASAVLLSDLIRHMQSSQDENRVISSDQLNHHKTGLNRLSCNQTGSDLLNQYPTDSDFLSWLNRLPTGSDRLNQLPTSSNTYDQHPTSLNLFDQHPTGSNWLNLYPEGFISSANGPSRCRSPLLVNSREQGAIHLEDSTLKNIKNGSEEYSCVVDSLINTDEIQVVKIFRIQNSDMWQSHFIWKKRVMKTMRDGKPLERVLYHGTDAESASRIAREGFNRCSPQRNDRELGQGSYFYTHFSYAADDRYSVPHIDGQQTVIISRVLTGDFTVGLPQLTMPPRRYDTDTPYCSTVDRELAPTTFCVYHDDAAYPEYIVTFRKLFRNKK